MTWLRTIFVAAAATTVILSGQLSAPASADGVKALVSGSITGALARLDRGLPHVAARFAERQPVKIVAFGSSSTEGAGASSPAKTYPSRLNEVLRTRFPGIEITVENQGVGGEDAEEMLARLDRVIASKPDLILWQVGTNAVLAGLNLAEQANLIRTGLARMKATRADVVLIDPQYVPEVINKPNATAMVKLLDSLALESGIAVFHRFAVMQHWSRVERIPFRTFTSTDGLHMNDWSYSRIAKLLADAIVEASDRTTQTARSSGKVRS